MLNFTRIDCYIYGYKKWHTRSLGQNVGITLYFELIMILIIIIIIIIIIIPRTAAATAITTKTTFKTNEE